MLMLPLVDCQMSRVVESTGSSNPSRGHLQPAGSTHVATTGVLPYQVPGMRYQVHVYLCLSIPCMRVPGTPFAPFIDYQVRVQVDRVDEILPVLCIVAMDQQFPTWRELRHDSLKPMRKNEGSKSEHGFVFMSCPTLLPLLIQDGLFPVRR